MENGCICCSLQPELIKQIHDLAHMKEYDYCLIECSGITNPRELAAAFFNPLQSGEDKEVEDEGNRESSKNEEVGIGNGESSKKEEGEDEGNRENSKKEEEEEE